MKERLRCSWCDEYDYFEQRPQRPRTTPRGCLLLANDEDGRDARLAYAIRCIVASMPVAPTGKEHAHGRST